jgi:hypothetical protein
VAPKPADDDTTTEDDDDQGSRSATIDDVRDIVDAAVERLTEAFTGGTDDADPAGGAPADPAAGDTPATPSQVEAAVERAVAKAMKELKARPAARPAARPPAKPVEEEPTSPDSLGTKVRQWLWA